MVKEFRNSYYYKVFKFIINNFPEYEESWCDSISDDQYQSKEWLCNVLDDLKVTETDNVKRYCQDAGVAGWKYPLLIDIVGSWLGWPLIEMIHQFTKGRITQIDCFDIDETCQKIMAQYKNMFKPNYEVVQHDDYFERKDVRRRHFVICTSCEHMDDFWPYRQWYKGNPFVCLQSNNYLELPEHINCVESVDELIEKNKLKKIWFKGERDFKTYKRFMVIGQWQ